MHRSSSDSEDGKDNGFGPENVSILFDSVQPHGIEEDEGCHRMSIALQVECDGGFDVRQFRSWRYGPS